MQFLERITEKITKALRTSYAVIVNDIVGHRPIAALGLKVQLLPSSVVNPADPFYFRWAEAVSTLVGRHLCGPKIPGVSLHKDPVPLCSFPDIDSSECEYLCAPIMGLDLGGTKTYLAPCHGKDTQACRVFFTERERCVMIKSAGCPSKDTDAYNVAYSMLDLSNLEYTVYHIELYRDGYLMLGISPPQPFRKTSDQIAYIYLQIDFPFDTP